MKAQFKYAFLSGFHTRVYVFAVIFLMDLAFVVLGSLGLLPLAAQITAVSLSGTAVAVMAVFNIISDVGIARRMYAAPGAYLHALTPAPRANLLAASVVSMTVMDIVTMVFPIIGVTWLSLILSGNYVDLGAFLGGTPWLTLSHVLFILLSIALGIAGYLMLLLFVLFCVTVRRSVFYQKPAGGLLTGLLGVGAFYVLSLSAFILAPFGHVYRWGLFFNIALNGTGQVLYTVLVFAHAAALFAVTSKLMERRMNI